MAISERDDRDAPPAHWVERLRRHLERALAEPVERVETHLSWLLLAGSTAYKIKKPVVLPFVDYASLQARRTGCEEELRLNRRLAPAIYLGISRITGSAGAPRLDGDGPAFDYAVRMRRFAPHALLADHALAGTLRETDVDRLAERLAALQAGAPRAVPDAGFGSMKFDGKSTGADGAPRAVPDAGFGSVERRTRAPLAALDALAERTPERAADCARLGNWLREQAAALAPRWRERLAAGCVREGHGDLHLANVVLLDDAVTPFDAIEFDPALRWIDIVDDAAFAAMDLIAHRRADLAWRFVNAWLEATGDHDGLPLWRHALVYRALVRALVRRLHTGGEPDAAAYLDTALRIAGEPPRPRLLLMHGLPGSGKSHVALRLATRLGAIRLRSDVERKRLFGLSALADTRAAGDAYGTQATQRTYARLAELTRGALAAGWPAIVDAAFLRADERRRFAALAAEWRVPCAIVHCTAPDALLRERVAARRERADDPSEADVSVLQLLGARAEPLDEAERSRAVEVDTARPLDDDALLAALRSR